MRSNRLDQLDAPAHEMAARAMHWLDPHWDEAAGLWRAPAAELYEDAHGGAPQLIRETVWYSVGLLLRDAPGDHGRARRALDTVLRFQLDAPDQPYHGTWYRSPDEPPPPPDAVIWRDYDPNWREFIGTALAIILLEYEERLPAPLVARVDAALRLALAGTLARAVPASYTNIALMSAFLLQFCAERFGQPELSAQAEQLAAEIQARFAAHGTFDEYNSPTYYGIDLYALALWRAYSSSAALRAAGAELEAALWRDIAQFYHAGLLNIAGPYDRSYGMDLRQYVACLGMWIWLATGYERAPFPRLDAPLEHGWDFAAAPLFALIGLQLPADAREQLLAFRGERLLERVIETEPRRVATAWLSAAVMVGGEDSTSSFRVGDDQFHPATIHWRAADDAVGWIKYRNGEPVDARAEPGGITLVCSAHAGGTRQFEFLIHAPRVERSTITRDRWSLPGLEVRVTADADAMHAEQMGDLTVVRYTVHHALAGTPIRFTLRVAPLAPSGRHALDA